MATAAKRTANLLKVFGFLGVGVVVLVIWLIVDPPGGDGGGSSSTVPAPSAEMSQETSTKLAAATAAQGVCYGWRLDDGATTISRGSNLGPAVAVDSDPARCPQWVEVHAWVSWTDPSSEAQDSASVTVTASGNAPSVSTLDRFGLTTAAFIDNPDWAVCQAALTLPLLMAESGAATPVPTPAPAAAPSALPSPGNDFWRDRWPFVVAGAVFLAIAALVVLIGWFERRHQRATTTT